MQSKSRSPAALAPSPGDEWVDDPVGSYRTFLPLSGGPVPSFMVPTQAPSLPRNSRARPTAATMTTTAPFPAAAAAPAARDSVSLSFDAEPAMPRRSRRRRAAQEAAMAPPSAAAGRKRKAPPLSADSKPAGRLKKDPSAPPQDSHCCICMTEPEAQEVATIDGCGHQFCFSCIEKWADHENKCPLCKERFHKIERIVKPKRVKGKSSTKGSKKVKNRDQHSETHMALGNLFEDLLSARAGFPQQHLARLLFSNMGMGMPRSLGPIHFDGRGSAIHTLQREPGPFRTARMSISTGPAPRPQDNPPSGTSVDALFDSSDDEFDDEQTGYGSFVAHLRRSTSGLSHHFRVFEYGTTTESAPPPAQSYAINGGDQTAGQSAENALEIEDDSDSSIV